MTTKYPRTFHHPQSPGATNDDKILKPQDLDNFIGKKLTILEKIDGSNACINKGEIYNRSHAAPASHKSFHWFKQYHKNHLIRLIPKLCDTQYFFEYCYAVHSIEYKALPSYLFLIGVREDGYWYSFDDLEAEAEYLGIPVAPVLMRDFSPKTTKELEETMKSFMTKYGLYGQREGIVVRIQDEFKDEDFSKSVLKMVRAGHVTTNEHWSTKPVQRQRLIGEV